MRRIVTIIFILGLLLFLLVFSACSSESNAKTESVKSIPVEVYNAAYSDNNHNFRYSGTVEEFRTIRSAFPVSGIIEDVNVVEGQEVAEGQLLASLDSTSFKNAYRIAKATYKRAQDALNRLTPLYENGNLSEIDFVEAQTAFEQASASLEIAEKNLNDCFLFAGMNGVVGKRGIDPGIGVAPGFAAFTLVEIDSVFAVISVHENEISLLNKQAAAFVSVPALGEDEWEGTISEIGVVADPLSHTYKVKILIENSKKLILPGMICNVNIVKEENARQIIVPSQSVMIDDEGQSYVYTVDKKTQEAKRKFIQRGHFLNDGIEVTEGLEENDLVVSVGYHRLYDRAQVKILNSDRNLSQK